MFWVYIFAFFISVTIAEFMAFDFVLESTDELINWTL